MAGVQYIFDQIGTENKFFVEFGFDAGTHEGGSGSNTFNLKTQFGWHGLLMDGKHGSSLYIHAYLSWTRHLQFDKTAFLVKLTLKSHTCVSSKIHKLSKSKLKSPCIMFTADNTFDIVRVRASPDGVIKV